MPKFSLPSLGTVALPGAVLFALTGVYVGSGPGAVCKTATVGSPYSTCYDIYTAAKITAAQFKKYNPNVDCNALVKGQKVCISSGKFPGAVSTSPNGTCYEHWPISGDSCAGSIAPKYGIKVSQIEDWNKDTYKFNGCSNLQLGWPICVSSGKSPPIPVNPALECGPESKGNATCPLKACCSAFGYCGLDDTFCSTKGPNPCISNCGTPSLPSCSNSSKRKIGYYSGWADRRSCVKVDPNHIDLVGYTHVNFAFAVITQDYKIDIEKDDVDLLKMLVGRKKDIFGMKVLISLGGWAFSEKDATKDLFSVMISTSAHRSTFINSVKSFLPTYQLDGIDIDFEYPGAAERDAPKTDTPNLTQFMKELRSGLGSSKVISVAAPAGYWFLKGFEIDKITGQLDFINMMSYDYHGPWDTNVTGQAPLASPQTSIKDIQDSALLYTRAGIDLHKVNLGLALYGRSYHLASASCKDGYKCKMTGGGAKGRCTGGSGILAQFEIEELAKDKTVKLDKNSQTHWFVNNGDLITFDRADTRGVKRDFANNHCFGGVFYWANDLVAPVDPPEPKPPPLCDNPDYNFKGWTQTWADIFGGEWITQGSEGGSICICCWGSSEGDVLWHDFVGMETMVDYVWQFGLQGSDIEGSVKLCGGIKFNNIVSQVGDSSDDALWGALASMKYGDYMHVVYGDDDEWNDRYDAAVAVIEWVADSRDQAKGCPPGVFWTSEGEYPNTITNALWAHANLRAYKKFNKKKYLDDATDIIENFFGKYTTIKENGLYDDGLNDDCTSDGHPQKWSYNQGVMLSNFGLMYRITKDDKYLKAGNDLINAVRKGMVSGGQGILTELCDPDNSCNFDSEGFKGIFMKHMQYFYDAVGQNSILRNDDGWHSDWLGLNLRGAHQYGQRSEDHRVGSVWYGAGHDQHFTSWTLAAAVQAGIAGSKWGTCSS